MPQLAGRSGGSTKRLERADARDCGDFADPASPATRSSAARRPRRLRRPTSTTGARVDLHRLRRDQARHQVAHRDDLRHRPRARQPGGAYFVRYDGATGQRTPRRCLIDDQPSGHQIFPDISADGGVLHALWWDSRNDPCYSAARPIGNCADRRRRCRRSTSTRALEQSRRHMAPATTVTDVDEQPELRAVRRSRRAVRRRLPLGHGARQLRVRHLDGLAQHGAGHGSAQSRPRTRTTPPPMSSSAGS